MPFAVQFAAGTNRCHSCLLHLPLAFPRNFPAPAGGVTRRQQYVRCTGGEAFEDLSGFLGAGVFEDGEKPPGVQPFDGQRLLIQLAENGADAALHFNGWRGNPIWQANERRA